MNMRRRIGPRASCDRTWGQLIFGRLQLDNKDPHNHCYDQSLHYILECEHRGHTHSLHHDGARRSHCANAVKPYKLLNEAITTNPWRQLNQTTLQNVSKPFTCKRLTNLFIKWYRSSSNWVKAVGLVRTSLFQQLKSDFYHHDQKTKSLDRSAFHSLHAHQASKFAVMGESPPISTCPVLRFNSLRFNTNSEVMAGMQLETEMWLEMVVWTCVVSILPAAEASPCKVTDQHYVLASTLCTDVKQQIVDLMFWLDDPAEA